MRIGNIAIDFPVFCAPMAGVTDKSFRQLVRRFGCGLVYTEMISAKALLYASRRTFQLLDLSGEDYPVGVQLFGSEPGVMAEAAVIACQGGAALIDLNMGCPAPKIVKNGEGVALMRDPVQAGAIMKAVAQAVKAPVTVKMRLGWDSSSINVQEMVRRAEVSGIAAVTLHGRTGDQLYRGEADWETIARIKKSAAIPVVGNGDIDLPYKAKQRLEQSGCDAVMIGRGCLGNPWIFQHTRFYLEEGISLPPPSRSQRVFTALEHLAMVCRDKGEDRGVREMRKQIAWYLKGLEGAANLRRQVVKAHSLGQVQRILEDSQPPAQE